MGGPALRVLPFSRARSPVPRFHVDHIIAKQHLDEVSDDPQSLAWACSECNYHKGFSARRDDWNDHFTVEQGMLVGLTPSGRATARLLNMNAPRLVRLRRELIEQAEF